MIRRLRAWHIAVMAAALLTALVVWLWTRTPPKITDEQFDKIQVGMTLAEVNAVLSCTPGNHTCQRVFGCEPDTEHEDDQCKEWIADKPEPRYSDQDGPDRQDAISIIVWFDRSGAVVDKLRTPISYPYCPPSTWEEFRRLVRTIAPKAF